jgi:excisionase family DNA binding protein
MTDATADEITLFQIAEVARRLSVSTKSVRRWIASGELAAVRLGRSVRISQPELACFVASRTLKNNNE